MCAHEIPTVLFVGPPADGGAYLGESGGGPERSDSLGVSGHGEHVARPSRWWAFLVSALFGRGGPEERGLGVGPACFGWGSRPARNHSPKRPLRLHLGNLGKAFGWLVSPIKHCGGSVLRGTPRRLAHNQCGFADPLTLVLIGGLALGYALGGWKPLGPFKKKPPTEQLTKLQAELDKAIADTKAAVAAVEAAKTLERQKLEAQIRAAQQDNLGAVTALKKVPTPYQTPEVRLAQRMAMRVDMKLAAAIGKLPEADQQAMIELIEQALSDKQAEVDLANQKLAALDSDFKAVTGEREKLKAEIPKLTERATKAEETAKAVQSEVTAKTEEVKTWANKADAALRENGGLWSNLKKGALLLVALYAFLAFGLPAIVKVLASNNPIKSMLRDVSGYLLNPVLHHDAKRKIKEKGQ